jgi:fatty-acyl-CoA synthase
VLSYAHGASSLPLLGETVGASLERTAGRLAGADALVCGHQGVRWSYGELNERVDALARGLLATGLQPGDRAGIWSPNCAEWIVVQFATAKAGVVLVNINPAYRAGELAYALRRSGCRMLVAAPSFKTSDYAAMIEQVRGELPDLERVVFLGSPEWKTLAAGDGATGGQLRARTEALQFDDPINIQYTSGTTGFPKGATLSHHNILNNG